MAIFDAVCDIPIFTGIGALWMAESISTCNSSLHFNYLAFLTIPKPNSKLTILNTSFISFLKKVLSFGEKCYFGWNKMLTVTYLQRRQDLYGYLYFHDKKREMRNATPLLCKNTPLHKKSI